MSNKELRRLDIKTIKNPDVLKELSYKELDLLSKDIRDYILDVTSTNGGHVSSNLGTVETIISLCRNFDFLKDKIIFDVGHQCYTYKILTGRPLDNFRRKGGISGFQKIDESPYDHYECGHSSTSISVAEGFAEARDLKKENYEIIAFIGDSSISNGLAYEALNNLASSGHKVIIVLNDNGMSISKPVGGLSSFFRQFANSGVYTKSKNGIRNILQKCRFGRWMLRRLSNFKNWVKRKVINLSLFEKIGLKMIGPVDGHYIKDLDKAFAGAKKMTSSVVVHVKTIKGKGYPYAENDDVGDWHGLSSFDKNTGLIKNPEATVSWSEQYKIILKNEMELNDKIVTIVAATGHGSSLDSLFEIYPERTIDVGIAEEHALTMAGGLSISGLHPVVSIYSTFLQRAYDELSHDVARLNLNATLLIDRAGLVGADGDTHQGIYDEAFLFSIPNVTITMAARTSEALSLVKESLCNHGVFAIRYPREYAYETTEPIKKIPYGSWKEELLGTDVAIVSVGPVTLPLKEKIEKLDKKVTLFNAVYLRPMDEQKINSLLNYNKVIIYNPYATKEGFANALASRLAELGFKGKLEIVAIPNQFVKQATIAEQREELGVSVENVLEKI